LPARTPVRDGVPSACGNQAHRPAELRPPQPGEWLDPLRTGPAAAIRNADTAASGWYQLTRSPNGTHPMDSESGF
jgi:hypothetical protein